MERFTVGLHTKSHISRPKGFLFFYFYFLSRSRELKKSSSRPVMFINLIVARCIFCRITSIYQPTNAHIISHKTLLKHFKTLRYVSILSDHHQGALFLAKVMLQYSQFNSYLQTRCCGSTAPQHIPSQHDALSQHLVCKYELNCEYCNITLARNKAH